MGYGGSMSEADKAKQRSAYRKRRDRQLRDAADLAEYRKICGDWRSLATSLLGSLRATLSDSGYQPDEEAVNNWQGRLQEIQSRELDLNK